MDAVAHCAAASVPDAAVVHRHIKAGIGAEPVRAWRGRHGRNGGQRDTVIAGGGRKVQPHGEPAAIGYVPAGGGTGAVADKPVFRPAAHNHDNRQRAKPVCGARADRGAAADKRERGHASGVPGEFADTQAQPIARGGGEPADTKAIRNERGGGRADTDRKRAGAASGGRQGADTAAHTRGR